MGEAESEESGKAREERNEDISETGKERNKDISETEEERNKDISERKKKETKILAKRKKKETKILAKRKKKETKILAKREKKETKILAKREKKETKKTTKNSKKKKKIIISVIIIAVLFAGGIITIRIITAEREPISILAFIEVMHENGYELLNATGEAVGTSFEGNVNIVLVAANENHQFELFEFINTRNAQLFFQDLVTIWEANSGLSPLPNSLNGMNFSIFRLTTNDNYYQILRVENILILAQGNQSCRSDIREMFRLIEAAD